MANSNHNIDRALNIDLLGPEFIDAIQKAWCKETCWPGSVEDYPENPDENPSFGNCLVTTLAALAARDFRDDVIPSKVNETIWHFRLGFFTNDPDDPRADSHHTIHIDATWQQFDDDAVFRELEIDTPKTRTEYQQVILGSFWEDDSLVPRLQLLLNRMRDLGGYEIDYTAIQIVGRLQDEFSFVKHDYFIVGTRLPPAPPQIS